MSATPVTSDPRWTRFATEGLPCACGEVHKDPYPLQMLVPLGWPHGQNLEPDAALRMDGNFLSPFLSVWEGKWFSIRVRMPLPLLGSREHALLFTVWVALDRPDFEAYVEAMKTNSFKQNAGAPARLVNRIGSYPDTARLMGVAYQQTDGGPPYFLVDPAQADGRNDHPLAADQRQGITMDRMLEIYAAQGHDMRAASPAN